jgi:hypothetical protein
MKKTMERYMKVHQNLFTFNRKSYQDENKFVNI